MRSSANNASLRSDLRHPSSGRAGAKASDLAVAVANQIAEVMMDVAGPLFWAALVLGFITGAFGTDLFR